MKVLDTILRQHRILFGEAFLKATLIHSDCYYLANKLSTLSDPGLQSTWGTFCTYPTKGNLEDEECQNQNVIYHHCWISWLLLFLLVLQVTNLIIIWLTQRKSWPLQKGYMLALATKRNEWNHWMTKLALVDSQLLCSSATLSFLAIFHAPLMRLARAIHQTVISTSSSGWARFWQINTCPKKSSWQQYENCSGSK